MTKPLSRVALRPERVSKWGRIEIGCRQKQSAARQKKKQKNEIIDTEYCHHKESSYSFFLSHIYVFTIFYCNLEPQALRLTATKRPDLKQRDLRRNTLFLFDSSGGLELLDDVHCSSILSWVVPRNTASNNTAAVFCLERLFHWWASSLFTMIGSRRSCR